jgi:transposase-like protein
VVHCYRNVWTAVPTGKVKEVAAMLKAIRAQEDAKAAKENARQVVEKLRIMRLAKAAEVVENGIDETRNYYAMLPEHWRCLPTNNPREQLMREIRRRTLRKSLFLQSAAAQQALSARRSTLSSFPPWAGRNRLHPVGNPGHQLHNLAIYLTPPTATGCDLSY